LAEHIAALTPGAYQPGLLLGIYVA